MSGNVDAFLKIPILNDFDTDEKATQYKPLSRNKYSLPKSSTGSQVMNYLRVSTNLKEIKDDSVILVESAENPGKCSILNPDERLEKFVESSNVFLIIYPPSIGLNIITPDDRALHRNYNYKLSTAELIEVLSKEKYNFKYPIEYNLYYYPRNPYSFLKSVKGLYDQFPSLTTLYLRKQFWINPITDSLNINELSINFAQAVEIVLALDWVPRAVDVIYLSCILIRYDVGYFSKDISKIKKLLSADNPKKDLVLSKHIPFYAATDSKIVSEIKKAIVEDKYSLSSKDVGTLQTLFLKECSNDPFLHQKN